MIERRSDGAALVVDRDAGCVGCDYNLRGLDAAGACPECGESVAASLTAVENAWPEAALAAWRRACRLLGASGFVTAALPVPFLMTWFIGSGGATVAPLWLLLGVGVVVEHGLWAAGLAGLSRVRPVRRQVGVKRAAWLRRLGWLNLVLAVAGVVMPALATVVSGGDAWGPAWGGVILAGVLVRLTTVSRLGGALVGTLRAAGRTGRARHVRVTMVVVMLLCGVQAVATGSTVLTAALETEGLFVVAIPLGIGSLFALPLVAGWAAFSVLQAAWAFGQRGG